MSRPKDYIPDNDSEVLAGLAMDFFHRAVQHYGMWYAETEHQLGRKKALEIEAEVWPLSLGIQLKRLGKILGFELDRGLPRDLALMPEEKLKELLKAQAVNWLANDGIWFQAVEKAYGMFDAKRANDTCWGRFSPFEAESIRNFLGLGEKPGLEGLKTAMAYRLYAVVNEQSIEDIENGFIFRMNNCRVQAARKRKGMEDYPCKSGGVVEYRTFASTIDERIQTRCIGCPPDEHPEEWFCAWEFTLVE